MSEFRTALGEKVFKKYQLYPGETWANRARTVAEVVCGGLLGNEELDLVDNAIRDFRFLPGGRYLYYSGRPSAFYNNCFLLRAEEDTRQEWARLAQAFTLCLMVGGGVGCDYSRLRCRNSPLKSTGGVASGAVSCAKMMDGIGHEVRQGGGRRSALYASLNWQHGDIKEFLIAKNWHLMEIMGYREAGDQFFVSDAVDADFDYQAPLSHTNMSINYDDAWLDRPDRLSEPVFLENVFQAMMTGEPGFSFNFGAKSDHTLRNACTEVDSADDSDVCNLGSVNMAACQDFTEFVDTCYAAALFQICGSVRSEVPYDKVRQVRDQNRRIGVGLMGVHEWLLWRGHRYEMVPELRKWLVAYRAATEDGARTLCERLSLNEPIAYRAIAPTGTIGLMAGTTQGIEPVFAVAYQRRWRDGDNLRSTLLVDGTAHNLILEGIDPDNIETANDLAMDIERRIKFQADLQVYIDQGISSTINLPHWGTVHNNAEKVRDVAKLIAEYAPQLRGLTFYPDGARGGQPIVPLEYGDIRNRVNADGSIRDVVIEDNFDAACKSGVCGV